VVVAFLGIVASSFFKLEVKKTVRPGDTFSVGSYQLRYLGVVPADTPHLESAVANIQVSRDGREIALMAPAKLFYKREQQPATRVAIRSTPLADLYVVLAGLDENGSQATFEVFLTPLVFWLWAGGLLMVVGTVVVMWPNVRERAAIAAALGNAATREPIGEPAPGGE
jgi:cytochrome c-type biogenesis protein CcmF